MISYSTAYPAPIRWGQDFPYPLVRRFRRRLLSGGYGHYQVDGDGWFRMAPTGARMEFRSPQPVGDPSLTELFPSYLKVKRGL